MKVCDSKCENGVSLNGGCLEAQVADLRLGGYEYNSHLPQEPGTMVSLLGRCISCGAEAMSEPFHDLSGLGKMLERFRPSERHLCAQAKVHTSPKL